MSKNELCVFVASADRNVGKYVNIITHAVTFLEVGTIKFIKLTNNDTLQDFDIATYVRIDINDKLRELSNMNPNVFRSVFDVFSNSKKDEAWDYLLLKNIIKKNARSNTFYDLTSLPKAVSIDIFIKLISCDVENIINFEFLSMNATKKDYHELNHSDFRVVRLVDEDSFIYTVKKYARQQNHNKLVVVFCCTLFAVVIIQKILPVDDPLNWLLSFCTLVSGAIPFVELLGLLNLGMLLKKILRIFSQSDR